MPESLCELLEHETVREVASLKGSFGIIVLHGGIEPPTYEIAEAVAVATGAGLYAVDDGGNTGTVG